jgi:ubiquinone/menaquinone biosynthesis C-methylase UbiE
LSSADKLKDGMRWMWSLGDYTRLAQVLQPHAEALADACAIKSGEAVLDVAAGNGNFAIAAARRGALVTACDLTPHMVDLGRAHARSVGANIEWNEADAEQLPFSDCAYDLAASVFGAMFAPQPRLVASEMFRVVRPGGTVAMANYSPGGFLGRMSDLLQSFSSVPALSLPSPFLWGNEDEVRSRFADHAASIEISHHRLFFQSTSTETLIKFWEETNPPQNAMKALLPPDAYQRLIREAAALVNELNESTTGLVTVSSPYMIVVSRKP